ncbi:hypothetical protein GQ457_12G000050 [Hibiscus cannabinus]
MCWWSRGLAKEYAAWPQSAVGDSSAACIEAILPLQTGQGRELMVPAGVVAVLVVVVWLDTGIIGGDAGGVWLRSAVAVGSTGDGGAESSALASASGTGLAGEDCQLVGENFSHVDFETRHDSVYQQQPRSIHCLIVGCGQEVSLHECVPQLGFRQQTLAAD